MSLVVCERVSQRGNVEVAGLVYIEEEEIGGLIGYSTPANELGAVPKKLTIEQMQAVAGNRTVRTACGNLTPPCTS